jgi:hypothetical protein
MVERNATRYSTWQGLHLSPTFSSGRIATHHAAFSTSAFCKVQLILRSCGCGVVGVERNALRYSAWLALHLSLTLSKVYVQPRVAPRSPPRKFLSDCILQNAIDFAELRMRSCGVEGV